MRGAHIAMDAQWRRQGPSLHLIEMRPKFTIAAKQAIEVGAQGGHQFADFLVQGSLVHAGKPPVADRHAPVDDNRLDQASRVGIDQLSHGAVERHMRWICKIEQNKVRLESRPQRAQSFFEAGGAGASGGGHP